MHLQSLRHKPDRIQCEHQRPAFARGKLRDEGGIVREVGVDCQGADDLEVVEGGVEVVLVVDERGPLSEDFLKPDW